MSTKKEEEFSSQTAGSQVSKFYEGKSLFITGAAGFLGVVLLETLLRCCPLIQRIYILLRPKKGVQPQERKEQIFDKEIFFKVKEDNPEALDKVVVVPGDVAQENLGMSEDDLTMVSQEVSVVFHCAATIAFLKPISFTVEQNVIGTLNIIEFCRKVQKLEALVYTSTAYSNCNHKFIEEKIYKLPFAAEKVVEISKTGTEEELNCLFEKCNPKFPNFYTFSKCVAENLIAEKASDLPVSIVRPSIIICCLKGVMPGFIEHGSGLVSIAVGIGKGFIRILRVDKEKISDHIPVDVVANNHILAAFYQATERLPSPFIYNCTSGELAPHTWGEFINVLYKMALKNPLPNSYQTPSITLCKSAEKYWALSLIDHYISAVVIDFLMWISGQKPRLFKLYQLYDRSMKAMEEFVLNEWKFECENFKSLSKKLNTVDEKLFPVDLKDFNLEKVANSLVTGAPVYRKIKNSPQGERQLRLTHMRTYMATLIKFFVLGGVVLLCSIVMSYT